jgi:hypothetical protein
MISGVVWFIVIGKPLDALSTGEMVVLGGLVFLGMAAMFSLETILGKSGYFSHLRYEIERLLRGLELDEEKAEQRDAFLRTYAREFPGVAGEIEEEEEEVGTPSLVQGGCVFQEEGEFFALDQKTIYDLGVFDTANSLFNRHNFTKTVFGDTRLRWLWPGRRQWLS